VHVRFGGRASETGDGNVARRRCSTLPYIPMARGFVYLAAVVDWFSRRVLAWRVSITLEVDFCLEAVEEALSRIPRPVTRV
jgi:transposase InsO family protein